MPYVWPPGKASALPEAMLQSITGATGREANQLVTLGRISSEARPPSRSWMTGSRISAGNR